MDVYSLISCIPIITTSFTQKCGCFQNHSDIFLFLKHIMKYIKTTAKSWAYFYDAKCFGQF